MSIHSEVRLTFDACTSYSIKLSMFVFKLVKHYQIKLLYFEISIVSLLQKLFYFEIRRRRKKSIYEPTTISVVLVV